MPITKKIRNFPASKFLPSVLILTPISSFIINIISWIEYGIDFPFADDWLGLAIAKKNDYDFSYIFRAIAGTIAPVGYTVDYLAQRFIGGNSIGYQLFSLITVLGGILFLQWRLLKTALIDNLRASICFSLCIFTLQPGSYWGAIDFAYHQALPVLFMLAALVVIFKDSRTNSGMILLVFTLGLLSGLSYISGAFASLSVGGSLWAGASILVPSAFRKSLTHKSIALFSSGIIATSVQISATIEVSKNTLLAFPSQSDFWLYSLGKFARALNLPINYPVLSLVIASIFLLSCFLLLVFSIAHCLPSSKFQERSAHTSLIFISLLCMILVYVAIVASARALLRPEAIKDLLDVFVFGFHRFHFFWITIVFPWYMAMAFLVYEKYSTKRRPMLCATGLSLLLAILILGIPAGLWDHASEYRNLSKIRSNGIKCFGDSIRENKEIRCPLTAPNWFDEENPDLTPAYVYSRNIGASYVKQIPVLPLEHEALKYIEPLFTESNVEKVKRFHANKYGNISILQNKSTTRFKISISNSLRIAQCSLGEMHLLLHQGTRDSMSIIYNSKNSTSSNEVLSPTHTEVLPNSNLTKAIFQLESKLGFEGEIALEFLTTDSGLYLSEIAFFCRLPTVRPRIKMIGNYAIKVY